MPGAKRQGREKPAEGEQRKVRAPEWGPQQGQQRCWLAHLTKAGASAGGWAYTQSGARGRGSLSPTRGLTPSLSLPFTSFESACPHASKMYFPLFSKTDLSENYNTDCPRAVTRRGL